jgi:flagellar hook-length control protein FliK
VIDVIDAQLGPPPVAAGRGGAAPAGRAQGDSATGDLVDKADGGFVAVLDGHTPPDSTDAPAEAQDNAAGPPTGELPTETVADADGSALTATAVTDAALAAIAAALAPVVPATTPAAAATGAPATTVATQTATTVATPPAGIAPAAIDADGKAVPTLPTAGGAPALAAAATAAGGATEGADAPAATLTLTLTPTAAAPAQGTTTTAAVAEVPGAAPAAPAAAPAPAAPAPAPAPAAAVPAKADPAPAPSTPDASSGLVAPAAPTPAPAPPAPSAQAARPAVTSPHELAHQLGERVRMAVREGGRELVLSLRPPELGQLTIRVSVADGVLHAHIVADRPEAARMLQGSLQHLGSALGDLGYSLDNLDVAYGGRDPRDAPASSHGSPGAPVSGEVLEADGTPAVPAGPTSTAAAAGSARLDLLA